MNFQNYYLHVFKFDLDPTDFHLQFDTNKLHWTNYQAGKVKLLHLQLFTNTQNVPEILSDLTDNLALAPDLQFMPQLTIQQINMANCSEEELHLKPDQEILTLNFPTKQILSGI